MKIKPNKKTFKFLNSGGVHDLYCDGKYHWRVYGKFCECDGNCNCNKEIK